VNRPYFVSYFSKKLKLLHVKRLLTFIRDFTAIVDKSIADGVESLPSYPYSAVDFSRALRTIDKTEVKEHSMDGE
jgi:hypothetical protein